MLLEAGEEHGDLGAPLDAWYRIAKKAEWKNLMEARRELPTADAVGKFTVFNIKGNAYRLITEVNYRTGRIFLRHVLTHAEYGALWRKVPPRVIRTEKENEAYNEILYGLEGRSSKLTAAEKELAGLLT